MSVEREVKLPVAPAFRVPALVGLPGGARAVDRGSSTLHTVYYDAPDLRLLRAGASLRYREGQGWTVKLPPVRRAPALAREELGFPDDGGVVPSDALALLRAYLRSADVVPVLRLRTERARVDIEVGERVVAELSDDAVEIVAGGPGRVRFRELEVERTHDDADPTGDAVVEAVVERLRAAGAAAPDPTPKPARALGSLATAPADVVVPELPAVPTAGDVVRHAVASSVLHLVRHDPVVRLGTDVEGVHQMRVATRRLRSDLRTFRPLVDEAWTRSLRDELGWLGDALGTARDADVLLGRIRGRIASIDETERPATAGIVEALERRAKEAHAALADVLASDRYVDLLDALVVAANAPSFTPAAAGPADAALAPLVRRPWKRLRRSARAAQRRPSAERLHRARIDAKRLRYASETVAVVVGEPARRVAARAEAVQDVLGEHQDAIVALSWLRSWSSGASADGAFAAGVLADRELSAAADARERWRHAWRRLERRKLRSWM
ncbi:MAG TPA: CYTH and CHAD domain-containing protein [Actinomycetota bacterium]|nr:CYTH and CHAD domain-containing protein [Actinomycetota bacterium]